MAFTPNTSIYLMNMPIEKDYKNQIYFSTKEAQTSFMLSRVVSGMMFDNLTYQRKDNTMRIPRHIDSLYNCNYVMYQNKNYTNKWFYAFITDMKYENDGNTTVTIETDVYQTWMFDIKIKKSFVEREHVMDDVEGKHTFPEGLETGEYKVNSYSMDGSMLDLNIVMGSTVTAGELSTLYGGVYNGIYSGVKYYKYPIVGDDVTETLNMFADHEKIEAVSSLFLAPSFLCPGGTYMIDESTTAVKHDVEAPKMDTLDGYTPKNKKLLSYPYTYLLATNGNGSSAIFHQELFNGKCLFEVAGSLTPGCSIRCYPKQYKGMDKNYDEGINAGKFPQCNWATDMYVNWLTQNGVNVATSLTSGVGHAIGGAIAGSTVGGPAGAIGGAIVGGFSGLSQVMQTMNQVKRAEERPAQLSGNINCGDVATSTGNNAFHFYNMSIKKEFAEMIDNFFEMFGYKVNQMKLPNLNGRPHWNYVKTIEINIDGAIPQNDLMKIKQMFNNGVTLWKDGNNVENYSLNNH